MFGLFKKRQPAAPPQQIPPPIPPSHPPEVLFDKDGIGHLVPVYLQLHLASRNPQHRLARRPDGSIDADAVPALPFPTQPQICARITALTHEQLPNDPSLLSSLTSEEIVSRLGGIYTRVTGKDMYAIVCKKWCVEMKLL